MRERVRYRVPPTAEELLAWLEQLAATLKAVESQVNREFLVDFEDLDKDFGTYHPDDLNSLLG
jgi:hypothetical protein